MSASIVLQHNPIYKEVHQDYVKCDVSDEIDVLVHCPCGASFYIYVPDLAYQCDTCKRVFRATVTLRLYTSGEGAT